jgi:hypothetical protein
VSNALKSELKLNSVVKELTGGGTNQRKAICEITRYIRSIP